MLSSRGFNYLTFPFCSGSNASYPRYPAASPLGVPGYCVFKLSCWKWFQKTASLTARWCFIETLLFGERLLSQSYFSCLPAEQGCSRGCGTLAGPPPQPAACPLAMALLFMCSCDLCASPKTFPNVPRRHRPVPSHRRQGTHGFRAASPARAAWHSAALQAQKPSAACSRASCICVPK